MIERRQRIPAEEVIDPKRWNLPYWVEPEAVVKAREKEQAKAEKEANTEVEVEEEEIEVEPLTAEQLENIRQDAYNEGLQQGLVEGRQKGEKLGAEEGRKEGLTAGTEEGRKLGFEAGNDEGKKQALEEGEKQTQQTIDDLQSVITNLSEELSTHKNMLEDFLPELVTQLAQAVINEELSQGSEHIVALVNLALAALPVDKSDLSIELNSKDLPFLEAAFEQNNIQTQLSVHDEISAGGCKLVTSKSVADFTLEDRWQNVLAQYKRQLQLGLMQDEAALDQAALDQAALDQAALDQTKQAESELKKQLLADEKSEAQAEQVPEQEDTKSQSSATPSEAPQADADEELIQSSEQESEQESEGEPEETPQATPIETPTPESLPEAPLEVPETSPNEVPTQSPPESNPESPTELPADFPPETHSQAQSNSPSQADDDEPPESQQ